jgi:hypothetical protein
MTEKIRIYDFPVIKSQTFDISFPGIGRIIVERKEVFKQAHNTAADAENVFISYEVYQKVDNNFRERAIKEVEKFLDSRNHKTDSGQP